MKRVAVITPPDARHGFALAGVLQRTPVPDQLRSELRALLADPEVGLVALDERLVSGDLRGMLREVERHTPGVVVLLPAPQAGARLEEDYVRRLIRRAIGYQVRLGA